MENVTTKRSRSSERNIRIIDIQSIQNIEEEIATHPLLDAQSKTQQKHYQFYEKHTTKRREQSENSLPEFSTSAIENHNVRHEVEPRNNVSTFNIIENVFFKLLGFLVQVISNIVKVISFLLYNQVLHNVVWVAITAVIEVFFFAVLGLCSVLVTIVMSLDEAYRRYQEVRFTDNVRPEREAFEPDETRVPTAENITVRPLRATGAAGNGFAARENRQCA